MSAARPEPFTLHVDEAAITDLHQRLARTRLPDQAPGDPWAYGTSVEALASLLDHWRTGFDWRRHEAALNAWPQYKVRIADIDLHYLHVPGKGLERGPAPMPLILSHGWPGSVFEFMKILGPLTDPAAHGGDPADAFTVIAPSLPGYGLSFAPGQKRFGCAEIADCFAELMIDVLGYQRFAAQGGDWGSFITSRIGWAHPKHVIGIHLNMMPLRREPAEQSKQSDEERRYAGELQEFLMEETGYQWIQGTRPQTLAVGLTDSPAGLAAWILEKFQRWTDCGGDPTRALTVDEMLADISLYWFTGCINASFWPYYDRRHAPWPVPSAPPITVPTGYSQFPCEILRPPRSLAEKVYTDIRRWSVHDKGGHFAAMEQPQVLVHEIREMFRPLRN
ncbi:MAG: alpha/beta fold hydrolase [Burkholderiaceae bacterium]